MNENQESISGQSFNRKLFKNHKSVSGFLSELAKYYEFVPRGYYDPDWDEEFPGSLSDVAVQVSLSEDIVFDLLQFGVVNRPITVGDVDFLHCYRLMLEVESATGRPKRKSRSTKTQHALNDQWSRWVYLLYLNNRIDYYPDGRMVNPENRIFVSALAREVEHLFSVKNSPELRQEIRSIRITATNDKRKAHDQGLSISDMALQRGLEQEAIQKHLKQTAP